MQISKAGWIRYLMPRTISKSWRALLMAFVAAAIVLLPPSKGPAHDLMLLSEAESERHSILGAFIQSDHDHSHEDGDPAEQRSGHIHGHNAADHFHSPGFILNEAAALVPPDGSRALRQFLPLPVGSFVEGPERPPRRFV